MPKRETPAECRGRRVRRARLSLSDWRAWRGEGLRSRGTAAHKAERHRARRDGRESRLGEIPKGNGPGVNHISQSSY